jgi:class 3 adenylate cyclase
MAILFTAKEKNLDRYAAFDYGAFDVVEKNTPGVIASREINIKARAALRYQEWSQSINFLRRYFDRRLFDTIQRDSSALKLSRRTITICFWDIREFSYLCEILKAHPDLIAGFLKDYFELAAQIIFKHNGMLDKFIGDGVMALFGVLNHKNDQGESDARNAVAAAIELRTGFSVIYEKWLTQWKRYTAQKIDIGLGSGIHTGEVLVGNVGTDFRDQFTALGPDVNLAARIEARSNSAQILISQATEQRVNPHFSLARVGTIDNIKNIPGAFELFEVQTEA